jgi:hypothetical protein
VRISAVAPSALGVTDVASAIFSSMVQDVSDLMANLSLTSGIDPAGLSVEPQVTYQTNEGGGRPTLFFENPSLGMTAVSPSGQNAAIDNAAGAITATPSWQSWPSRLHPVALAMLS